MKTIYFTPQNNSAPPPFNINFGDFSDPDRIPVLSPDRHVLPPSPSTGPSIIFKDAVARYVREVVEVRRTPRGQDFVTSLLRSRILPTFGDRQLSEITRSDIRELLRTIGTTRLKPYKGAPTWGCEGRANSVFGFLKGVFGWACDEEQGALLTHNPMHGIHTPYRWRERERVLNPQEIRYFWQATTELGYPIGTIAQLLLLTAQRRGEIANAYGGQIDRTQRTLTVPILTTKPHRGHIVPLSTMALEILDALPHGDPRDRLFTNLKNGPISRGYFHPANERIHKRMVELYREDLVRAGRDPDDAYIEWFCFHDLRRTAATVMCQLGVPVEVVDKVMNHANGKTGFGRTVNSVTRVYVRHEFMKERRDALQHLGQYIRQLTATPAVVADAAVPASLLPSG
jgi:integrase